MASVVRSVSPMWETQIEFPAPGFDLNLPQLMVAFGDWISGWKISISVPVLFKSK